MSIAPALVEKDYWIMHCLYGLQQLGMTFEFKGGTSLSKECQIIDRFSEDIDIRIEPPAELEVKTGRNQNKPAQVESRRNFHDWLAQNIIIDGIKNVQRDKVFDNKDFFSGGIRLFYDNVTEAIEGLRTASYGKLALTMSRRTFRKTPPHGPMTVATLCAR